ncbi:MAG TPA: HAMP domain-containing protein, partial [Ktedonobacteraceae bacterium]|nr:HAMP domain-containing protein [Ktedonobacteraceae bacterium]
MYIPLQLRLTLFYTLLLGLALWFFGHTVYAQAEQRAYNDLDSTLSTRAASVSLGKNLTCSNPASNPCTLPSVDALGTGGVAIEVLDKNMHLLATTTGAGDLGQPSVGGLGSSPIPWDERAARRVLQHPVSAGGNTNSMYSTIMYEDEHVRVYTLANNDFGSLHIIQTARSEQAIEQSLSDLQSLLLRGGALVLVFAIVGGWFITWGVLSAVRRMTKTAQNISISRNFSQRVPSKTWPGRDELATLADTFNEMLANLEELYQQQQRFVADASHELRAPI